MRKTKIVCTIGPACDSKEMLEKLIKAGMNVARLNFSHGYYKDFSRIIKDIRDLNKTLGTNVAIMQDLQGLKIRIASVTGGKRLLTDGEKVVFTTRQKIQGGEISVDYKDFVKDIGIGDRVFVVDGKIELKVLSKKGDRAFLEVVHGGEIASRKGVNVPDTLVRANSTTKKDIDDLRFGVQHNVDYIAISFIRNAQDIRKVREYVHAYKGKDIKILVKIETSQAIQNLEEVIQEADAFMIARGDLAVEISLEKLPLVQKRITALANLYGKPVITATEMLASMVTSPVPTRAEVSDVANAILEGTDAIMLSGETSVGQYPVQSVQMMVKTALEAEKGVQERPFCLKGVQGKKMTAAVSIAYHGMQIANTLGAKHLLVFTVTGFTATQMARFRSSLHCIVFTLSETVKKQLALVYGMNDIYVLSSFKDKFKKAIALLAKEKKIQKNDVVVTVSAGKRVKEGNLDEVRVMTME